MAIIEDPDRNFALLLQYELDSEFARYEQKHLKINSNHISANSTDDYLNSSKGIIDPNWELVDPTPNIVNLFLAFNEKYFWSKLATVCVVWSKRMMACAGICSYEGRGGLCKIALSEPLLKLRPRKDLVETLLHEMIHAFLFVTDNNRDRDGHGPEFHKHMNRINVSAGTKISVYHSFHDEVRLYQQHWWRCDGICQKRHPFYGLVRRSQNRAPGPNDRWYADHLRNCGGNFIKVKEPEKKPTAKEKAIARSKSNLGDIRKYLNKSGSPSEVSIFAPKISTNNGINTIHDLHDLNQEGKSAERVKILNNNITTRKSNANIVGFSDIKKSGFENTGLRNSSNSIIVTNKNINKNVKSTNNHETHTKTKSNSIATPSNGNKNLHINYDLVRNHWINKYATDISPKRSLDRDNTEESFSVAKKLKTTPTNKIKCPICSKQFAESEINGHIDICLQTPQINQKCKYCENIFSTSLIKAHLCNCSKKKLSEFGSCPICLKQISLGSLEEHVNRCIEDNSEHDIAVVELKQCEICTKHFLIEEYNSHLQKCIVVELSDSFSDDFDYVKCDNCHKNMDSDEYNVHRNVCHKVKSVLKVKYCHICKMNIEATIFADHLTSCFDRMIAKFNEVDLPSTSTEKETFDSNDKCIEIETVSCLVCDKLIDKSKLELHLEDCLNNTIKDINEYDDELNEDGKTGSSHHELANMYNCPICLKLLRDEEMNLHLDKCLKDN